ncbi:MAG: VOC family protein [Erythrobacter sp.]|uniref:VOC family protein n=1 Tax=Erythrobacter sp. TaxID=1042 RepID=UPI003265D1A7
MALGRIEHANLTVTNPERSAELFKNLLGWEERWRGESQLGGNTIHVGAPGNGANYMALYTNEEVHSEAGRRHTKGQPLNHVGLLVDDLAAAETVVIQAGLEPTSHGNYDPGQRFYFVDWDGIEFEVISYEGDA